MAGLSLGTSGAVRMVLTEPGFDKEGRLFCYALTDEVWVIGGAISNGGITLRWRGRRSHLTWSAKVPPMSLSFSSRHRSPPAVRAC